MSQSPASSDRLVVKDIGGFHLVRELGQGGMGKVFLARQASLDRMVALKVLQPDLANDVEFVARFHREARAAALFQHPNITAVIDAGQDTRSGVHFIAFEFLAGASLEDALKKHGTLKEEQILHVLKGCVAGLCFAETKGLVHRDIKPENILFDAHGTPKLADLGLARRYDADDQSKQVTQTGVVLGTPVYMAPEQALGEKELDIRADIYALGLCAWRCLAGVIPFDEDRTASALQILSRHINQDLVDIRKRRPETTERMALLIQGMTNRDRDARYGSASALSKDLDRVIAGKLPEGPAGDPAIHTTRIGVAAPTPVPTPGPATSPTRASVSGAHAPARRASSASQRLAPPTRQGPSPAIVAGVLGGALLLGIGMAYLLGRRAPSPPPVAASPSVTPAASPSVTPAASPSATPTTKPSASATPTTKPSATPTTKPSATPTTKPSASPSPAASEPSPRPSRPEPPPSPRTDRPPRPNHPPPGSIRPHDFRDGALALREAYLTDLRRVPELLADLREKFAVVEPFWPDRERLPAQATLELATTLADLHTRGLTPASPSWEQETAFLRAQWEQAFSGTPRPEYREGTPGANLAKLLAELEKLGQLLEAFRATPPTSIEDAHRMLLADVVRLGFMHVAYRTLLAPTRDEATRDDRGKNWRGLATDPVSKQFWERTAPALLRLITDWSGNQKDKPYVQDVLNELQALEHTALGHLLRVDLLQARLVLEQLVEHGDDSMCRAWFSALRRFERLDEPRRPDDLFSSWVKTAPEDPIRGLLLVLEEAPSDHDPLRFDVRVRGRRGQPLVRLGRKEAEFVVLTPRGGDQVVAKERFSPKDDTLLLLEFRDDARLALTCFEPRDDDSGTSRTKPRIRSEGALQLGGGPIRSSLQPDFMGSLQLRDHEGVTQALYLLAPRPSLRSNLQGR